MKILAVGGGSGGHVTPVVAVLRQIKHRHPRVSLRFWTDRHFKAQANSIIKEFDDSMRVDTITSGKFRRYHHLSVLQQLMWPSLVFSNIRDAFYVLFGIIQSFFKLLIWRPDVIFTKGGYVCLPVGVAAHMLRIPLVIHDSDAHPGLTNRVLSRWATSIGTGAPLEFYPYPKHKTHYVGIPISDKFKPVSVSQQKAHKQTWGVKPDRPLIVVTGGGLGAKRINDAVLKVLDELLKQGSVILVAGSGQYDELRALLPPDSDSFQLYPFTNKMPSLLSAADVVVTRAGATTILELAAIAKPTILIPNAKLTGGHQLKNAEVYEKARAVKVLDEDDMEANPKILVDMVGDVLTDPNTPKMTKRFFELAKPTAADEMAALILEATRRQYGKKQK